jgi:hypothetical protein
VAAVAYDHWSSILRPAIVVVVVVVVFEVKVNVCEVIV